MYKKMSPVTLFTFNNIALYAVWVDGKPWTRSTKVRRAFKYAKATKTEDIIEHLCSKENCADKCHLAEFDTATDSMVWPKDSRKGDYYISKKVMYELLFSSQHPKAKNFRKHYCNVTFLHIRQQLTKNMLDELRHKHHQAITDQDNSIQTIRHSNVTLQEQWDVYQIQLESWEATTSHVRARYVDHGRDTGRDNVIIIVKKQ